MHIHSLYMSAVPTPPRNLTVTYTSSTALLVTWEPPLCDYGNRTRYTVRHTKQLITVSFTILLRVQVQLNSWCATSLNRSSMLQFQKMEWRALPLVPTIFLQMPPDWTSESSPSTQSTMWLCMLLLLQGRDWMLLKSDKQTRMVRKNRWKKNVTSCTVTVVPPSHTAPPVVQGLMIQSDMNPSVDNVVIVTITWNPPSARNGTFNYSLAYTADQTPGYPPERRQTGSGSFVLPGSNDQYIIKDALPYANYSVTIFAFNIKRNLPGPSNSVTHRSLAISKLLCMPNTFHMWGWCQYY